MVIYSTVCQSLSVDFTQHTGIWQVCSYLYVPREIRDGSKMASSKMIPQSHFTKDFCAHNWNLVTIYFAVSRLLMIQSVHKFAHAMTIGLPWYMKNCDSIRCFFSRVRITRIFTRCGLWAHKAFVVYRKISNMRRTKIQNSNVFRIGLQLSLCNILKRSVKWRMKI